MYLRLNLDPQKLIVSYKKPHHLSNIFNIFDIKIYVKYFPNCTLALEGMYGTTQSVTYEVPRPERVANKMFNIFRSIYKETELERNYTSGTNSYAIRYYRLRIRVVGTI